MVQREALVKLIQGAVPAMAAEYAKRGRPAKIYYYNPSAKGSPMDFYSMPKSQWSRMLCDGIHLTPATYDQLVRAGVAGRPRVRVVSAAPGGGGEVT